ncbi:hypothetical protein KIPB_007255, partial [Kipferlia bialata]|eukprot:g7255.t1
MSLPTLTQEINRIPHPRPHRLPLALPTMSMYSLSLSLFEDGMEGETSRGISQSARGAMGERDMSTEMLRERAHGHVPPGSPNHSPRDKGMKTSHPIIPEFLNLPVEVSRSVDRHGAHFQNGIGGASAAWDWLPGNSPHMPPAVMTPIMGEGSEDKSDFEFSTDIERGVIEEESRRERERETAEKKKTPQKAVSLPVLAKPSAAQKGSGMGGLGVMRRWHSEKKRLQRRDSMNTKESLLVPVPEGRAVGPSNDNPITTLHTHTQHEERMRERERENQKKAKEKPRAVVARSPPWAGSFESDLESAGESAGEYIFGTPRAESGSQAFKSPSPPKAAVTSTPFMQAEGAESMDSDIELESDSESEELVALPSLGVGVSGEYSARVTSKPPRPSGPSTVVTREVSSPFGDSLPYKELSTTVLHCQSTTLAKAAEGEKEEDAYVGDTTTDTDTETERYGDSGDKGWDLQSAFTFASGGSQERSSEKERERERERGAAAQLPALSASSLLSLCDDNDDEEERFGPNKLMFGTDNESGFLTEYTEREGGRETETEEREEYAIEEDVIEERDVERDLSTMGSTTLSSGDLVLKSSDSTVGYRSSHLVDNSFLARWSLEGETEREKGGVPLLPGLASLAGTDPDSDSEDIVARPGVVARRLAAIKSRKELAAIKSKRELAEAEAEGERERDDVESVSAVWSDGVGPLTVGKKTPGNFQTPQQMVQEHGLGTLLEGMVGGFDHQVGQFSKVQMVRPAEIATLLRSFSHRTLSLSRSVADAGMMCVMYQDMDGEEDEEMDERARERLRETTYVRNDILSLAFDAHAFAASHPVDALPYMGYLLHRHFGLEDIVSLKRYTASMVQFQRLYRDSSHPSYHNSTHAVDVLQMVALMLDTLRQSERGRALAPQRVVCVMLLAAAAHDVEHCGVSSDLLTNIRHPLYHIYGSESTLEQYHSMWGMYTLRYYSVFECMSPEERNHSSKLFMDLIIATDPK